MNPHTTTLTIKTVLDASESLCLDNESDKQALLNRLVEAIEEKKPSTVTDWCAEIHFLAIEKGWWDDVLQSGTRFVDSEFVKSKVAEKLNLIHDEVSEASNEARQDLWDTYWEVRGEHITLDEIRQTIFNAWNGDEDAQRNVTRLMVLSGMPTVGLPAPLLEMERDVFLADLLKAMNEKFKPEGFGIELVDGIIRSLDLLEALGYDTELMMRMKHAHNKTRPYRHGNKRY